MIINENTKKQNASMGSPPQHGLKPISPV